MALVADRMEITLHIDSDMLDVSRHRIEAEKAVSPLVSRAIGRARAGDRDALRFLYIRYADDVYDYARTLVSDHVEAQEVTQRVFVELERLIDRYEEREAVFPVWIRRVARNVAGEIDDS
jgi:RNA polymerase sigma-70 factor (ECF subfamily)